MVVKITKLKTSDFYDTKSGMIELTRENFNCWKEAYKPVNILKMDSADGNNKIEKIYIRIF